MDTAKAYSILDLEPAISYDAKIIKKKYHSLCLKYHPDKNNNDLVCKEKFQEIQEAYDFLSHSNIPQNNSWDHHLYNVLDGVLPIYLQTEGIYQIIKNILETCEKLAYLKLEKLDVNTLEILYKILHINKDVLYIQPEVFNKLKSVIKDKRKNDECVILLPTIDDLFSNNIYKLIHEDETYLIPLWHKKLIYDHKQNELCVKCLSPDKDVVIDDKNNIYVDVHTNLIDLWNNPYLEFKLGSRPFYIPTSKLYIQNRQSFTFYGEGISKINKQQIYNVSNKANIYVTVYIAHD